MYSKDQIIEILTGENFYIDSFIFDAFIKNWKIEAIYEDENSVEFFDNDVLAYIRDGLNGNYPAPKDVSEPSNILQRPSIQH